MEPTKRLIDLKLLLETLIHKWIMIALVAVIGGGGFAAYKYIHSKEVYESSIPVIMQKTAVESEEPASNYLNDIRSFYVIQTNNLIHLSETETVKHLAAQRLGYALFDDISHVITDIQLTHNPDSQIITVDIVGTDEQLVKKFSEVYIMTLKDVVDKQFEDIQIAQFDDITVSSTAVSKKKIIKFALFGIIVGGTLMIIVITGLFLFDGKVKTEEELIAIFDTKVLARISDSGDESYE